MLKVKDGAPQYRNLTNAHRLWKKLEALFFSNISTETGWLLSQTSSLRLHQQCLHRRNVDDWFIQKHTKMNFYKNNDDVSMFFRQIFWCHQNLTCKVTKLMVIDYWTTNCARINWDATSKIEMTIFYSINAKRVVRRHLAALNRLLTGSNQREIAHHHLSCIANCVHAALSVLVACHRDNDDNGELRSTWEWASYIRPILIVSISKWHFCW